MTATLAIFLRFDHCRGSSGSSFEKSSTWLSCQYRTATAFHLSIEYTLPAVPHLELAALDRGAVASARFRVLQPFGMYK